jgi:hypothetical protein
MVRVLRVDGLLHPLSLEHATSYPLHPTPAGIHATGALEQSLVGSIDPETMLASPVQPRVEDLRRLDSGVWIVGYRLSGFPGRDGRLRYREIDPGAGTGLARACGHAIDEKPDRPDPPDAEPNVEGASFMARAAGAAYDLVRESRTVTVAEVARRLGVHRNELYRYPAALEVVRSIGRIDRQDRFEAARDRYRGDHDGPTRRDRRRVVRKPIEGGDRDDD